MQLNKRAINGNSEIFCEVSLEICEILINYSCRIAIQNIPPGSNGVNSKVLRTEVNWNSYEKNIRPTLPVVLLANLIWNTYTFLNLDCLIPWLISLLILLLRFNFMLFEYLCSTVSLIYLFHVSMSYILCHGEQLHYSYIYKNIPKFRLLRSHTITCINDFLSFSYIELNGTYKFMLKKNHSVFD